MARTGRPDPLTRCPGCDMRRILSIAAICAATAGAAVAQQPAAHAASQPKRVDAYNWAKTQDGCPYTDGGSGPCSQGYDCSGLVMKAYQQAGITLPHNTQAMINSGKLTRESSPRRGDLVFYDGNSHVEIYDQHGWTFGATTSGQNAGWHDYGSSYPPDAYYRVNGAG